ncbi:MAG: hypothetical protein AB2A00_16540 [Myxococcota bacterium]
MRVLVATAWLVLAVNPLRAASLSSPLGIHVELLTGTHSSPTSVDVHRALVDVSWGARTGLRRAVWGPLLLGGEIFARTVVPQTTGAVALAPLIPVVEARGNTPHQVWRWGFHTGAAMTLGALLRQGRWFLEPTVAVGLTAGARVLQFKLDNGPGPPRMHPLLGAFASVGVATGVEPAFFRLDYLLGHERGLPTSGVSLSTATLQFSAGVRW